MSALATGAEWTLAIGLWLVLAARISSSIPHVRVQVARLHRRVVTPLPGNVGEVVALLFGARAASLHPHLFVGTAAVVGMVVIQRVALARPPRPARVLGVAAGPRDGHIRGDGAGRLDRPRLGRAPVRA